MSAEILTMNKHPLAASAAELRVKGNILKEESDQAASRLRELTGELAALDIKEMMSEVHELVNIVAKPGYSVAA